ncbi:hypothetical protein B0H12DRAFT_1132056 [Mycena haematopus]|nr:hypothetical protein B0H12DRAFT_1132056 [Mycena haematopus]
MAHHYISSRDTRDASNRGIHMIQIGQLITARPRPRGNTTASLAKCEFAEAMPMCNLEAFRPTQLHAPGLTVKGSCSCSSIVTQKKS